MSSRTQQISANLRPVPYLSCANSGVHMEYVEPHKFREREIHEIQKVRTSIQKLVHNYQTEIFAFLWVFSVLSTTFFYPFSIHCISMLHAPYFASATSSFTSSLVSSLVSSCFTSSASLDASRAFFSASIFIWYNFSLPSS